MKKRNAVRIICFAIAIIAVAVTFNILSMRETERYKLQLENSYSRNLEDFNASINNIALILQKACFLTSPEQISDTAARLLAESQISKSALSQLPAGEELKTLNRFLSQVGNYALSVSKTLISNGSVLAEDVENIEVLSSTANKIAELVGDTRITYNNLDYWAKELDNQIDSAVDNETLASSLGELEGSLADFPTLIYDGPYSDHILEKEPELLKTGEEITEREALEYAAKAAECEIDALKSDGIISGNIEAFRFSGENLSVAVSKIGGHTLFIRRERDIVEERLDYTKAIERAKKYLERVGMTGFLENYYYNESGVCVINFAFIDGETICYTDLVKVGIAMDNGEVMLYEASGYISNHKDRAFETPTHTVEEAIALVSRKLTVNNTSLAFIHINSKGVRCYELACTSKDGQEILVYINTNTLKEEQILILLKSDGGTLVK